MEWLTPELRCEVKALFEPHYNRKLLDEEVEEIALHLTEFAELYCTWKINNETCTATTSR